MFNYSMTKEARIYNRKDTLLDKLCWKNWKHIHAKKKNQTGLLSHITYKNKLEKVFKNFNVIHEPMKLPRIKHR